MINKECRDTRREIDELELGHRPSVQATTHIAACAACQQFQADRTSLRELVGSLEPVVAPPDFDMRLRARIAAEKYDNRRQPFFVRLVSTPALAAAALFVIVAGSVFWISRRPSIPAVPTNDSTIAKQSKVQTPTPATANQSGPQSVAVPPADGSDIDIASAGTNRGVHRNRGTRPVSSEQFDVRGTDVIRQTESDTAYVQSRPVEFALQDERGKTRKISLPPVSFGAQNLVGSNRTDVKYTETSRVW
jgi:hypothetical protein